MQTLGCQKHAHKMVGDTEVASSPPGGKRLNLVRSVSWNYAGYFFEFVSGLLLLAFIVRRIPVHDYGIYLLAQSAAAFLYLLEFGVGNVLVPMYVSTFAGRGMAEVSRLASTLTTGMLVVGAVGAGVLSLVAYVTPRLLGLTSAQTATGLQVVMIMSASVMFALAQAPIDQLLQAFQRFDRVNQMQIGGVVLRVVLTVAVLVAGKGIVALAEVQVAVSLCRLLMLWVVAPRVITGLALRPVFDGELLRRVIRASTWSFGDEISRRIGGNSEQLILGALSSFQQVAIFGLGSRLPAHMYQFAARGLSVIFPTLAQHHAERDTARLRSTFGGALHLCFTGFVPLATFGMISARALMRFWAGPAYEKAGPVMACLLVSSLSIILMLPSDMVLYSHGRIPQAARFSIVETIGKVSVGLLLAGRYGAVGVAAGVAVWHWCVHLFLYFPAACSVAEMRPGRLLRSALLGGSEVGRVGKPESALILLGGAYAGGAAVLVAGIHLLSAPGVCALCALMCLFYGSAWASHTVIPMWRQARSRTTALP